MRRAFLLAIVLSVAAAGAPSAQLVPVTFAWDLDAGHAGATWEVESDGATTVIPCGAVMVLATDRRCTADILPGPHTFRLRGRNAGGIGDWSSTVSDTVPTDPGLPGGFIVVSSREVADPRTLRINFQPLKTAVPAGYLEDTGAPFANRGNGQSYGWDVDATAHARDRNHPSSPDQQHDTLIHLQLAPIPDAVWEIALPNGTYDVRLVAGDPQYIDSVYKLAVEGVLLVDGRPTAAAPWIEGIGTVTVADGRLTVRSVQGAQNNKLCFLDITPR